MRFLIYGRKNDGFTMTTKVSIGPFNGEMHVRAKLSLRGLLELREHSEVKRDAKSGQPCFLFEGHEFVLTASARRKLHTLDAEYVYEGYDR